MVEVNSFRVTFTFLKFRKYLPTISFGKFYTMHCKVLGKLFFTPNSRTFLIKHKVLGKPLTYGKVFFIKRKALGKW